MTFCCEKLTCQFTYSISHTVKLKPPSKYCVGSPCASQNGKIGKEDKENRGINT